MTAREPQRDGWYTRYVFFRNRIRSDGRLRWQAFEPKDGETSVYHIRGLGEQAIWDIGTTKVAGTRTLAGRADFAGAVVVEADLRLDPDPPPSRHANIRGWPTEQPAIMNRAQVLARGSVGLRAPPVA